MKALRSINRGMASVPSPYVLLLNNDIELTPDYLEKLLNTLEADETLGFATGKLLRATERICLDGAGDAMLLAGASYRLGHLDPDQGQLDQPKPLLSTCGAALQSVPSVRGARCRLFRPPRRP